MAIFGNEEVERERARATKYKNQILVIDADKKKLAAELSAVQQRCAQLTDQIDGMKAEIERARTAVRKARQRQKQSVARANRFKSKVS